MASGETAEGMSKSALHQQNQITWQHLNPFKFLFLNGIFHAATDLVLYPPDVIRTRMQVQVLVILFRGVIKCHHNDYFFRFLELVINWHYFLIIRVLGMDLRVS